MAFFFFFFLPQEIHVRFLPCPQMQENQELLKFVLLQFKKIILSLNILMLDHCDKMVKWFGFEAVESAAGQFMFLSLTSQSILGSQQPPKTVSLVGFIYFLLVLQPVGFMYYRVIYFSFKILTLTGFSNLGNTYMTKMCYELTTSGSVAFHHIYVIKRNGNGHLSNAAHRQNQVNV